MKRTAVLSLLAGASVLAAWAQSGGTEETISIDAGAATHPFPHFWEQMFGSGRANLSMRESYRKDLRRVRDHTGFTYIRFHAILDDENGVYDEDAQGRPVYNFSYVDQIYDSLLENNVKPFVELSFMPRKLAANLKPHPFWYKPFPSPPNDPMKWSALIQAFTQHLVERYGRDEVEKWYFEVWNEPNIDFWDGEPQQATYFGFYDITAKAVKSVDAKLRIGGPATAQAAWVDAFIAHCKQNGVPFDYVSTHVYGNEDSMNVFGKKLPIARRDMVARSAKKVYDQVKASAAPDIPIIWSEYNATYMNQPEVTDDAFMGPWLANNIRECDGLTNMMSYWTFSDVFEEQGVVKTPFYGGYGLIAERHLPKAAFWDFDLLHQLGEQRVDVSSENALVTKRADGGYAVALWNYAEPHEQIPVKTFHLAAKGFRAKSYTIQVVSPEQGSVLEDWRKMGSPALPTLSQIRTLLEKAKLPAAEKRSFGEPIELGPESLALVEFK
ncbi:MAG TPA: glycosyl hydrolase family 39 [Bryobacteraceae bacterium]|nr:glycosyl hydrolase family 39 [Bryobacteraceae bacterium]